MSELPFTSRLSLDAAAERSETTHNWFDESVATLLGRVRTRLGLHYSDFDKFYQRLKQELKTLKAMDKTEFKEQISKQRYAMVRDGLIEEHILRSFALVYFIIMKRLKLRPYKVQLMGAWTMMQGMLAEMETGEGKTLTACFPACTAAMARIPVHIITANDYLAERDAELMRPVYKALGLTVGVVTSNTPENQRHQLYASDITYTTGKQVALDYLRDRLKQGLQHKPLRQQLKKQVDQTYTPGQLPLLRGLYYAIVDEADSVLIDEARVPLILARENKTEQSLAEYFEALALARLLEKDSHYLLNQEEPRIKLTEAGQQTLAELIEQQAEAGKLPNSEALVILALRALYVVEKDKHYLVKDQTIQLIDENTGRLQTDRSWEKGLQQMVECKEGCAVSNEKEVLARISFQRFFQRYLHLAGMSGTAKEVAGELQRTYGLEVVVIPTRKPSRRKILPTRLYPKASTKWRACIKRIEKVHQKGRPVLVGTRSLKDSELLSHLLEKAGLPHKLLNARQDKAEAEIIAQAGQAGQITIATNMAGRGTDIKLMSEAKKAGGLHVISMELNDARRIDRQLYGRSARQGNRGSCEAIISLEDSVFTKLPASLLLNLRKSFKPTRSLPRWLSSLLIRWAQWLIQSQHVLLRRRLLKWDRQQDKSLAFSGKRE